MSLWAITLLSALLVLAMRATSASRRPESVGTIKALPVTLLNTTTSALALTDTTDANAWCTVFCPHVLRIWLVWRFWRTTAGALAKGRRRRGIAALAEPHKTLHTLVAVQLWVFIIPSQALGVMLLMLVQLVIWLVLMLLMLISVKTTTIVILLYPSLFTRTSALSRRWLVHGRIFDERLWHAVARIVGRPVILVLRVWVVVGRHRRWGVRLLRTLGSRRLGCTGALWWQLSRLGRRRKRTDSSRGELVVARQALDIIMTKYIPAPAKAG